MRPSKEEINQPPIFNHEKNNSLNHEQLFREQGLLQSSTKTNETNNLNEPTCLIKEEIISC